VPLEKKRPDNATSSGIIINYVTGYLDANLQVLISIQPGLSLQGKGAEFESARSGSK